MAAAAVMVSSAGSLLAMLQEPAAVMVSSARLRPSPSDLGCRLLLPQAWILHHR